MRRFEGASEVNTSTGCAWNTPTVSGCARLQHDAGIVLRFEADSTRRWRAYRNDFRRVLERARPGLPVPS